MGNVSSKTLVAGAGRSSGEQEGTEMEENPGDSWGPQELRGS